MPSALILIADGTEDIEVTTCVDILHRGHVQVTLLKVPFLLSLAGTATGQKKSVTCANGTQIIPDDAIPEEIRNTVPKNGESMPDDSFGLGNFDCLVIPGGQAGVDTFCKVTTYTCRKPSF